MSRIQQNPPSYNRVLIKPSSEGGTGTDDLEDFIQGLDIVKADDPDIVLVSNSIESYRPHMPFSLDISPLLNGPSSILDIEEAIYTISNYDDEVTYRASSATDVVVVESDRVIYKPDLIPIGSTTQQHSFILNGVTFTITVNAFTVPTPTLASPTDGFTLAGKDLYFSVNTPTMSKLDFIGTEFHISTVSDDFDINNTLVYVTDKTNLEINDLAENTTYFWKARFVAGKDGYREYGPFSMVRSFSTKTSYNDLVLTRAILPDTQTSGAFFGDDIAISKDKKTIAVSTFSTNIVFIFIYKDNAWYLIKKLTRPSITISGTALYGRGLSFCDNGNTLFVGMSTNSSQYGYVFEYTRVDNNYILRSTIRQNTPVVGDSFGYSLAVTEDGLHLIISAFNSNSAKGQLYYYVKENNRYVQKQIIIPSGLLTGERLGLSLDMTPDAKTLICSGHGRSMFRGAAYILTRNNETWSDQVMLQLSVRAVNDYFGLNVSISDDGNTVIIGAHNRETSKGNAYIYTKIDGVWTQVANLRPSDILDNHRFGICVFISGDAKTIYVSADGVDSNRGTVYKYKYTTDNTWVEDGVLQLPVLASGDKFGTRIVGSPDAELLVVTAPNTDNYPLIDCGVAYIYK